jgi:GAF domain-containing protein
LHVSASDLHEDLDQRTRERDEALDQLAATSDVLQIISRSPGELEPVFTAMLENAVRICEAKFGVLFLFEGDSWRAVALHRAAPPSFIEARQRHPVLPIIPGTALGRVTATKQVVQIVDVQAEPAYRGSSAYILGLETGDIRTLLSVPMLKEGNLVGALNLFRQEVRPFTDKQIELVKNFASQAVIAIENTRLLNELRESLQQQTATADVLKVISSSSGELQSVFDTMLAKATELCEASYGTMWLTEGDGRMRTAAMHGPLPAGHRERWGVGTVFQLNTSVPSARAIETHSPVQVADLREDRAYLDGDPLAVSAVELAGIRSLISVPMFKDKDIVGAIAIYRQEVRPFTDKQIDLVKNFAAQAVIAIENARLLNELRESLQQQTAAADVLKVISSSGGELQPVFDTLLENATRLCAAKFGSLYLCEGDAFRTTAMHNPPPAFAEARRREPLIRPFPGSVFRRVAESKRAVHVPDMTLEQGYVERQPLIVTTVELGGFLALLSVPMLKDGNLIGVITIYRQQVGPFSDKQIELVQNFAAQAVIAIENARLLNELRESLQQQTATTDVLKVISSSPGDLNPVFEAILENATRICEAKYGVMFLHENGTIRTCAWHGVPPTFAEERRRNPIIRPSPKTGLGRVLGSKQTVHIADVLAEPEYVNVPAGFTRPGIVQFHGARTELAVPMLKEGELVGVIIIYRTEVRPFTDKQIELVTNFGAQAVIAIENARLLDELRTRTNELAQSVGELQALGEVSQAVNSTLDLETVLTTIVGRAVELSRTDAGAIYVFDEEGGEFRLHATYGMSETMIAAITGQHIGLNDTNMGAAATQRKPIQVPDIRDQPSPVNEIVLREGYRSILIVPLLRPDHIVGALVVRRKTSGEFPQSTIELLQTFADQSVVAIQNARLFESVETRTRELAKSLDDLRTAQDRLVQTEKLASLGQLTAGIAHEIKNPLNFVNNFSGVSTELIDELQGVLSGLAIDPKVRSEIKELTDTLRGNLAKVVHHGKRADAIVKNMLYMHGPAPANTDSSTSMASSRKASISPITGRGPRSLASPSPCSDPSIRPPVKSTCFRRTSRGFC